MVAGKQTEQQDGNRRLKTHPFFEKNKPNYGIGGVPNPRRDLTYFVRWPKVVQLQRKRRILLSRIKAPAAIRQFREPVDKNEASAIFKLLAKYRPETRAAKRARLVAEAEARLKGEESKPKKPVLLKSGINTVTSSIESKKAKLVIIACDVDPIEVVVWLPALCKKMEIPYKIVKNRARLGTLIHKKTCSCVCIESVRKEDQSALDQLIKG